MASRPGHCAKVFGGTSQVQGGKLQRYLGVTRPRRLGLKYLCARPEGHSKKFVPLKRSTHTHTNTPRCSKEHFPELPCSPTLWSPLSSLLQTLLNHDSGCPAAQAFLSLGIILLCLSALPDSGRRRCQPSPHFTSCFPAGLPSVCSRGQSHPANMPARPYCFSAQTLGCFPSQLSESQRPVRIPCSISSQILSLSTLPLASLLFFKYTGQAPTSGPLHSVILPGTPPSLSAWLPHHLLQAFAQMSLSC